MTDGVLSPEPQTSSGKLTSQGGLLKVGGSGQDVPVPQGMKEVEALLGGNPTCHMTSLISDSWEALKLHFAEGETGPGRCHQLLKARAVWGLPC